MEEARHSTTVPRSLRLLFYAHDSYGLGHLRRTLLLSGHLQTHWPEAAQLILTGSPLAHLLVPSDGVDYIKLPAVVKVGAGRYSARSLPLRFAEIRELRQEILESAARHFRPDVMIVDHAPAGLKGELVSTLRRLRAESPSTRLVLGLRDVIDEPGRVRRDWTRNGVYELLDELYDLILVYGQPDVYDLVREYGFSPSARAKTRYVGYLRRPAGRKTATELRSELGLRTENLVVVTAGGGGDGSRLLEAWLEGLRSSGRSPGWDSLVVPGPLMRAERRERVRRLVPPEVAHVHVADFVDELSSYVAAADAVVSMGGYNSVSEIVCSGRPAVIVPRAEPRREQLIRARLLSRRGLVRMIHPAELTPRRLLDEVRRLLAEPGLPAGRALRFDGLPTLTAELRELLGREAAGRVMEAT